MITEIIPDLWIGNKQSAKIIAFMAQKNIVCVINCTKDIPFYNNNVQNIRIPIDDNLTELESKRLYQYLDNKIWYIILM